MTLAVVWYREKFGELWCAADTRISGDDRVLTDSGPKIFQVPVVCHEHLKSAKWRVCKRHSFGFAYAGSTLCAISTHSIATACTQNLAQEKGFRKEVSVESIANLYSEIATRQVIEMSSRQGIKESQSQFFFDGLIFGFCPAEKRFMAFVMVSSLAGGLFHFNIGRILVEPGWYLPIGSGESAFVALRKELQDEPDAGVISTLREMVKRETRSDVGGYLQVGICNKLGFRVVPVLDTSRGPGEAFVSFLGWDTSEYKGLDGYTIGYSAIRP